MKADVGICVNGTICPTILSTEHHKELRLMLVSA